MTMRNEKYKKFLEPHRAILLGVLLSIVTITGYFQFFSYFDAVTYFQLSKHSSEPVPKRIDEIVLIQSNALYREHEKIASTLVSYNVKYVIFLYDAELPRSQNISHIYYPNQSETHCLMPPSSWHGYLVRYAPNQADCDSLWKILYPDHQSSNKLVNYRHLEGAFPQYNAEQLLARDLYLTQLEHKIVVVAQRPNMINIEYPVPSTQPTLDPAKLYLYLAFNFENNIFDQQISLVAYIISTATMVILLLIFYQRASILKGFFIAISATLLSTLTVWLALTQLHFWLPLGNWMLFIWLSYLFFYTTESIRDKSQLLETIQVIRERMMGHFLLKSFTQEDNPWDSILTLVQQQLDLKRSIFLDRVENASKVKEIRALGCSLEDIVELRRNYEREPYACAIKALGTVAFDSPFFKSLAKKEKQYLVPLIYAGDVRGFWAMTLESDDNFDETEFIKNVNAFAAQIGELLFHHHVFRLQQELKQNTLIRTFQLRFGSTLGTDAKFAFNEVEQKLSLLEHVFAHLMNATVIFNLFGQVVQTNQAMETLARRFDLMLFDMSALDLLSHFAPFDNDKLESSLRFITLFKGVQFYPVLHNEYTFILKVSALENTSASSSGTPIENAGIIFEFFDLTEVFLNLDNSEKLLTLLIEKLQTQNLADV